MQLILAFIFSQCHSLKDGNNNEASCELATVLGSLHASPAVKLEGLATIDINTGVGDTIN